MELKVAIKEYYPKSCATRIGQSSSLAWSISRDEIKRGKESFLKEARKMAKINQLPGVVQVREFFEENDTAYIVMNFIEGITLKSWLAKEGIMNEKTCANILLPVIRSLSQAHDIGMVHRDISPDNLMLDKQGKIWILDFGADGAFQAHFQCSQFLFQCGKGRFQSFRAVCQYRENRCMDRRVCLVCYSILLCVRKNIAQCSQSDVNGQGGVLFSKVRVTGISEDSPKRNGEKAGRPLPVDGGTVISLDFHCWK